MARGRACPGTGRKLNAGIFGEKTFDKRIPVSLVKNVDQFVYSLKEKSNFTRFRLGSTLEQLGSLNPSNLNFPLLSSSKSADFPAIFYNQFNA